MWPLRIGCWWCADVSRACVCVNRTPQAGADGDKHAASIHKPGLTGWRAAESGSRPDPPGVLVAHAQHSQRAISISNRQVCLIVTHQVGRQGRDGRRHTCGRSMARHGMSHACRCCMSVPQAGLMMGVLHTTAQTCQQQQAPPQACLAHGVERPNAATLRPASCAVSTSSPTCVKLVQQLPLWC